MSTTLNFIDQLVSRGRRLSHLGRDQEADEAWSQLAQLRDLAPEIAEEAQTHLAETQLEQGDLAQARRHLSATLMYRPDSARHHHWMASALNDEDDGDLEGAAEHYRKSLKLQPEQPYCLAEYGLLAIRLKQVEEGLDCLSKAAALSSDTPEILEMYIEGLCRVERWLEARQILLAARFRNRRDARFEKLWNDFQFRLLHEEQETARRECEVASGAENTMILPFRRPTESAGQFRQDSASRFKPPHLPRAFRILDKRHA